MDEVIGEFLVESREGLDHMERDLVLLEKAPGDAEILKRVFRAAHTIKGAAGFLGFTRLQQVTHAGENLLALLRDGKLHLDAARTSALLSMLDSLRALLEGVAASGAEPERDVAALVAVLEGCCSSTHAATMDVGANAAAPHQTVAAAQAPMGPARAAKAPQVDNSVRVDVTLLDQLMNLVSELVLTRNRAVQQRSNIRDLGQLATIQRLDHITSDLQERVMKTRMQQVGSLWSKLPRVVRDLALSCGKEAQVLMEGEETELDRTILDAVRDPLTHLVRNAVDHGLEKPAERIAAGKPGIGTLRLRAWHAGGQVNIELSDDGRGINVARVKEKAVAAGRISADAAARMEEREALNLIFLAGLSTAEKVTNISGRGVGMDVVRTHVEQLGGSLELSSTAGHGTAVRIRLPLTLAIVPALIVKSGAGRFAIPHASLHELVRLGSEGAISRIERVRGSALLRLRGKLLPLVALDEVFQGSNGTELKGDGIGKTAAILEVDNQHFGVVVDAVLDSEEIVVKPLGRHLKHMRLWSGATIMGDGALALILDAAGLAAHAGVLGSARDRAARHDETLAPAQSADSWVVLHTRDGGRFAVPLGCVLRLEAIEPEKIERKGLAQLTTWRGATLPLVDVGTWMQECRWRDLARERRPLRAAVCITAQGPVGFVVERISEISKRDSAVSGPAERRFTTSTVTLAGKLTEALDTGALAAAALKQRKRAAQKEPTHA
jgi:two-component system chemotaxis sensor kinase CheA